MDGINISTDLKIAASQFKKEKEYWIDQLSGEYEICYFPYDYREVSGKEYCRNSETLIIEGDDYTRLMEITGGSYPKIHMVLTAAVTVLSSGYIGTKDMVLGTTIEKQDTEDSLINALLPLRVMIPSQISFKELILEIRRIINEALEHQNYPIETITGPYEKFFDIVILLENIQEKQYIQKLQAGIMFTFVDINGRLEGELIYDSTKYKKESIQRIINHYLRLLHNALFNVSANIDEINFISQEEIESWSHFNSTEAGYPGQKKIHELFEEQVEKTPDNIAVVEESERLPVEVTYQELNERANRVALWLMKEGFNTGKIVGIMLERSVDLVAGIIGILKAGCTYLPIDPEYPQERIDYISRDSGVEIILNKGILDEIETLQNFKFEKYDRLKTNTEFCKENQIAYIIYTSGSSGRPKGVVIEHHALINYIWWASRVYVRGEKINFPFYTSIGFDLTITSLFTPLITGNTIYIYNNKDNEFLLDRVVADNNVDIVKLTPAHLMVLGDSIGVKKYSKIKRFIVGGDKLEIQWAQKIHANFNGNVEIYNEYGPTEATVGCMIHKFDPLEDIGTSVPIGKPANNVQIYILGKNMKNVHPGGIGELYIAGDSLSNGYLNKPELTSEKFIPNPFDRGTMFFKTGDLARKLQGSVIEFLGRNDNQVKIKGFRIELGEIETQLTQLSEINDAIVVVKEYNAGDKYLCAYIVLNQNILVSEIRECLSKNLPEYMIPSYFIKLEKIPLNLHGKVDTKALPDPISSNMEEVSVYLPPRNAMEKLIVDVWEEVLGRQKIGVDDNFFMLGGDSIKSIQITSRIANAGYKIEMKDIFQYPVISDLAPRVKKNEHISDQSFVNGIVPLVPIQRWFFEKKLINKHHFNQSMMIFSGEGFDEEEIRSVFIKLQEHHDALRMTFKRNPGTGEIIQMNQDLVHPLSLERYNLKNIEDSALRLRQLVDEMQGSLDIENGPLMKLGLFHLEDGDRLLIVVHHLVVDGVSWRILGEDIETLMGQIKRGENLVLPMKTDSYKYWSEKLVEFSNSKTFLKEKNYWIEQESKSLLLIPKDFDKTENYIKEMRTESLILKEEETEILLTGINHAYKTEINDILLTALGIGIKKTWGLNQIAISLEGHGREDIGEQVDISRTVGWFTSVYPVILDFSYSEDIGRQIKETKEKLRKVPNKGIGYGILKYLTSEENKKEAEFRIAPEISFNYLGQFDSNLKQKGLFEIANESSGNAINPDEQREYILEINGMITNNRLSLVFAYNRNHFKHETIERLVSNFNLEFKNIIDVCRSKTKTEQTPSDFTYKGLSIETVDKLVVDYPGIEDVYTLTPMQEGMLFHTIADESSQAYFEQTSYRINGDLNIDLIEKSLNLLFKRHDILRTVFLYKDIQPPVQVVLKDRGIEFYYKDISGMKTSEEKERLIHEFKENDRIRSFDLSKDVLMRVSIFRFQESVYEFIWSFHHILMDGWCVGILNAEFFEIYSSYVSNRAYRLADVKPYRTYIQWLEKQDKMESARYWENYVDSYEEQAGVPRSKILKEGEPYRNETIKVTLNPEITSELTKLAGVNHVTLNTVTQVLWGILLGKYNGKKDVIFGSVVSGRPFELEGVESMVGLFINTVPVRVRFEEELNFQKLLHKVQEEALISEPYYYHPLSEIQAKATLKQNLIDHLFIFENYPIIKHIEEGFAKEKVENAKISLELANVEVFEQTNYNFNIEFVASDRIVISFQYNGNIYERDFIEQISRHYCHLIEQVIKDQEIEIRMLNLLSREEKNRILYEFNNSKTVSLENKTICQLFEEQAEKIPLHTAVVAPSISKILELPMFISYKELDEQSDQVAHFLKSKGVHSDIIVGIMMERSLEIIIGMLGIFKAGGAYLPIAPDFPKDRIDFMVKDSCARVVLTGEDILDICFVRGEQEPFESGTTNEKRQSPTDLAYVIYTSGSTGKPKGALVEHIGMINHIDAKVKDIQISSTSVIAQNASHTFDISVWQFFAAFTQGGKTVIYTSEVILNPDRFNASLIRDKITILEVVPSYLSVMLNSIRENDFVFSHLRFLLVTGEEVKPHLVSQWFERFPGIKMVNAYGPTEASDDITHHIMDCTPVLERIPIGKPLQNMNIFIVDSDKQLCPVGVKGEIWVSGIGVGRGYLNDTIKTDKSFMRDPFFIEEGLKLYKTGDLGCWLSDGSVDFFGRTDFQVKIHGFRIDLGEIENRLLRVNGVIEAVVIAREESGGDKYLCAYFVSDREFEISELRSFLSKELPDYMIPSYFMRMENIPLSSNGKVDRKALPGLVIKSKKEDISYLVPSNAVEKKLVEVWGKVLGRECVGINENFFMIGGDSIKSIQIISRMNSAGYKLEMKDLFQYPVISELAPRVKKIKRIPVQSIITGTVPLTPIQYDFFNNFPIDTHHFNQAVMLFSREGFETSTLKAVFVKILEHHDALRMTYQKDPRTGEVIQLNHGLDYPSEISEYNFRNHTNSKEILNSKINEIQASINLENGPLIKLGLFHLDDGDRLLIVVHHLVMDGISWRILLEDIETLYGQFRREEKLVLPLKTDSFKIWSGLLSEYANSKKLLKEKNYWSKIEATEITTIPKDFDVEQNYIKDRISVSFTLEEEETESLFTKVNEAYRTEINDILLTALGIAMKETFGVDRVYIGLEGHGREEILDDITVNRTIGWFTSLYPVLIDVSKYWEDFGRQIKEVKETLRCIPNKGIGYGILKYLTKESNKQDIQFKLKPEIGFNYMGRFDAEVEYKSFFEIANESVGNSQSLNSQGEYLLDVTGMAANNRLTIRISFNKTHFKMETMNRLIENFDSRLKNLITHCSAKEEIEYTPSDFTYKGLSIDIVSRFMQEYQGIEDIYTLTPMQEGMLFHALTESSSFAYFEQMSYRIHGELDIHWVEKSLNELFKRHDILRTSFIYNNIERPVQIVMKERMIDFYFEDIRKIGDLREIEKFIRDFKTKDKEKGFNLSKNVLMRVSIFRLDNEAYEFTWSFHHILMDGWCIGILNREFFEIYSSFIQGRSAQLPGVKPYRTYIQWLENHDKEESTHYWENYLSSYEEQSGIPKNRLKKEGEQYKIETLALTLDTEKTSGLNALAGSNRVTLNIISQVIWGILLGKYNGKNDVVFGSVVSGRPSELEGVETMVGLFINTIPVRIKFDQKMKFYQLLQQVQNEALVSEPHHYNPLAEIQSGTLLKQNLIDHIFIFENYPIAEQIEGYRNEKPENKDMSFQLANLEVFEQTNYDFNIVFGGSEQLSITIIYNSNVYTRDWVEMIYNHFCHIVDQVIENNEVEICNLTVLSENEKERILFEFNNTETEIEKDKTIHLLFEEQAHKTPDKVAVSNPIDLTEIYDMLDSGSVNNILVSRILNCCFFKNPFICQTNLELQSSNIQLTILKTNRHNSVIVSKNTAKLIDLFDGKSNLKAIFSHAKGFRFKVYSMKEKDLLEVTFQFNEKPEIFSICEYDDLVKLVQTLYKNHIIELKNINAEVKDFETSCQFEEDGEDSIRIEDILLKDKKAKRAHVLLVGDTPGIPSTGLLYLASYLKRNGIDTLCQFYDPALDFTSMKRNVESLLDEIQPEIVGISMKWFLYIARVIDICKIVKEYSMKKGIKIKVVVGGNTASYYWEEIIKYDCIDYLIRGDGEEPLLKIAQSVKDIPNCIKFENGQIIETPFSYVQDGTNSRDLYLSHLDEILLSNQISRLGTFFIYTVKGCTMNCLYCGGCQNAQQRAFNRKGVFKRAIEDVRKDIIEARKYTSTFHFEFDILDKNLLDYCTRIWEGLDLSDHFCIFSTLTYPSDELIDLVSVTFKYVYWDFDICSFSERHRKQLESLGLVKPQPSDVDILAFLTHCESHNNIEVRLNSINGLPYFTLEDLEMGEKFLSKLVVTYTCLGELHWARLHAQPGAPILESDTQHQMHSFASTFQDFMKYSEDCFNRYSEYSTVENFNYPYIYYNDELLNSKVTSFYIESNKTVERQKKEQVRGLIISNTLTYRELDEKSSRVASMLKVRGIIPGDIVGLKLERSNEIPIGILGILKSGSAYLPIDPEFPEGRIDYMLKDSGAKLLITKDDFETLGAVSTLQFPFSNDYPVSGIAYIIYTSGTTGKPKGVAITHENLSNYVLWFSKKVELTNNDKTVLTTSFAFDLGYTVLYTSLLNGCELHILPRETYLMPERLLSYIKQKEITYIKVTPSLLGAIVNSPAFSKLVCKSLRLAAVGGEAINVKNIEATQAICSHLKIMNHYGPTETTIGSVATLIDFDNFEKYREHPAIGKPIHNASVYILGKDFSIMPVGIPGELFIAGSGVGMGYLNRPELTSEKFIDFEQLFLFNQSNSKFRTKNSKIYCTGDLVRWLPDGNIEFLGRIDNQVKVRGYRIELGEIENRLRRYPGMDESLVMIRESETSEKYICAYVVTKDKNQSFQPIKKEKKVLQKKAVTFKEMTETGLEYKTKKKSESEYYANRLAHLICEKYDDSCKLSDEERNRYQRQMLLAGWGQSSQEILKGTTVFVAGAGGGASPTVTQLALAGFGTIKICDFDEVEVSNLNRQFLHNDERVGMNKAISAQIAVSKTNPHVQVIPYTQKLTRENVFELVGDSAVIFDMFDGPADKFVLSECAVAKKIPHLIISMTDINAYAAILHSPHTPCFHCLFDKEKLETIVSGMKNHIENYSKNPLPVVSTSLFISTGIVVNEALKVLLGFDMPAYNRFFYFNQRGATGDLVFTPGYKAMTHLFSEHFIRLCKEQGFDWEVGWRGNFLEEFKIEPDPNCPVCGVKGIEKRKLLEEKIKNSQKEIIIPGETKEVSSKHPQVIALLLHGESEIGVSGALRSGKIYVYLDVTYSMELMSEILEDSGARIIVTDNENLHLAEELRDSVNKNIAIINISLIDEVECSSNQIDSLPFPVEYDPDKVAYIDYSLNKDDAPGGSNSLFDALREYLRKELPDYMIPSKFVSLDKLPLTPNGKVDRNLLPEPGAQIPGDFREPGNELEEKLVEIWSKIFKVERIGIDENFFSLGLDSIKAIQAAARMNKEGLKVGMNEILSNPSIAQLSHYVVREDSKIDQGIVEGEFTLTPIQEWFFETNKEVGNYFNMSVMLKLEEGVEAQFVRKAFEKIVEHHDALRIIFELKNGKIIQKNRNIKGELFSLEIIKIEKDENVQAVIARESERIQQSGNLQDGPLVKLGLFKTSNGDHLLISINHLVFDGISWRILFEDIGILYQQYQRGEQFILPIKTSSYKDWSEKLSIYANQKAMLSEKSYWEAIESVVAEIPRLPRDFEEERIEKDSDIVRFNLSEDATGKLLTDVNQAFSTEINDILLTALGNTIKRMYGQNYLLLSMEGHGREQIIENVDISRTIGWFTSLYPVLLNIMYENDLARQIKEVKETLRRLPNKGIGYGILKYLTASENKKELSFNMTPRITFNYLGQFDSDVEQMGSFTISDIPLGRSSSPDLKNVHDLEISGMVADKKLVMSISFSTKQFKRETISTMADILEAEINHIISFCMSREDTESTPGDFTYKGLSIDQFDNLFG